MRQGTAEGGPALVIGKALSRAGVVRQFPAQVIAKRSVAQPRKEIPRQTRKSLTTRERCQDFSDFLRRRVKQGR